MPLKRGRLPYARLMIEDGKLNYEDIAMYTELTLEEVEKIALEKKSA